MAEREQTLVDHVEGGSRAEPLDHGGFDGMRQPGVTKRQRMIGELPAGGELRLALDQWKRHALELRDRSPKGFALAGIGPGLVDRSLRGADALQRDERAAVGEAAHDLGEPASLGAETVVTGICTSSKKTDPRPDMWQP